MAYTGTGTETDPYIVDNWADFISLCPENCYIKWADSENKTVEKLSLIALNTGTVIINANVDFNGWTFEDIELKIETNPSVSYYCQTQYAYFKKLNISAQNPTITIKNLVINHISIPKTTAFFYSGRFYDPEKYPNLQKIVNANVIDTGKIIFYNVYCNEIHLLDHKDYELINGNFAYNRIQYIYHGENVQAAEKPSFEKCILKYNIDRCANLGVSPFVWYKNCEISINGETITELTGVSRCLLKSYYSNGVFYIRNYTFFENTYISGNITVTKGNGVVIGDTSKTDTHYFEPKVGLYNSIVDINLEFNEGTGKLYIDYIHSFFGVQSNYPFKKHGSMKSLFVKNWDVYYTGKGNYTNNCADTVILPEQIRNINFLLSKKFTYEYSSYANLPDGGTPQIVTGFDISADDGIRYTQFNNTDDENWTFRVNPKINDGKPFLPFWKYIIPVIPTVSPVPYRHAIRVHDGASVRTAENKNYNFETNGIRIIFPISCKVTEELNGLYICELEHHIDDEGDWLTLAANNVLSVPIVYHDKETQQLFRITNVNTVSSSRTVKITARHIFYDLIVRSIDTAKVVNLDGYHALYYLFNAVYINETEEPINKYWYNYQFASDITDTYSAEYEITNLAAAIIGEDNSVINQLHGELYRDNFYFSINKEKEYCIKNENVIAYGVDMIDIDCNINWDNFCNYLLAKDNFGNEYAVSWADFYGGELGKICKILRFNYDYSDMDRLVKDTNDYFDKVAYPDANYKIKFAKLKNTELYKDFINLKNNEVGDTIKIRHYQLNIDAELKIIKKVYDVLRQETESIEVGAEKANIIKKRYLSDTIFRSSADVRALEKRLN